MKKVAIFMSDFHLGQKDQMEEFHADEEFAELLGRLSLKHDRDDVDLVLLGDVMDLWTTIPESEPQEMNAQTAAAVSLYLPVMDLSDQKAVSRALDKEKEKVEAIIAAHLLFFESLARFLCRQPQRRQIIYVPGNHDHSVVHEDLQKVIRDKILEQAADLSLGHRIVFRNYYGNLDEEKCLQVYAEHGNQLTYGGVFRYADEKGKSAFETFGVECPEYVQFKLVSNRLERRSPELDSVFMEALEPHMWPGVLWWLFAKGNFRAWKALCRFTIQYEHDDRQATQWARKKLPPPWKTFLYLAWNRYRGVTKDEYGKKLLQFFDQTEQGTVPLSGKILDPLRVKTIILGHTHQARDIDLPGLGGVKYYNTGSWLLRYENGRRVIEQTWVTISVEVGSDDGGCEEQRRVIDREMIRRNVELSKSTSDPVTSDGNPVTQEMRAMPGLRVGDVVLFHLNFGVTVGRLLKSGRILELLFHALPDIAKSWFNRYGTGSYWNHIALVYGSPSEKEEVDAYNDVLFLEAIPESGVTISGPKHYLTHRKEWNMGVLQPKAEWLNRWENRRLLRRLALGALQTHYDNKGVEKLTLRYTAKTMDTRGRVIVGSLVKGAFFGVLFMLGVLISIFALKISEGYVKNKSLSGLAKAAWEGCQDFARAMDEILSLSHLLPFEYIPIRELSSNPNWTFKILGTALLSIHYLFFSVLAVALFWLAARIILAGSAFSGAGWGALIVPPMAELCEGWTKLSKPTRWVLTAGWVAIPLAVFVVMLYVSQHTAFHGPMGVELAGAFALFMIAGIVLFISKWPPLAEMTIARPLQWCAEHWRRFRQWVWPNFGENQTEEKQFICSELVQYALLRAADQVGAKRSEVDVTPPGESTLPRHFAESDNFKWSYLLIAGEVIPNPGFSHRAQVSSGPCEEESWKLNGWAIWAGRFAFTSLLLIVFVDLMRILQTSGWKWYTWALWGIGVMSGLSALLCARFADRDITIDPATYRGTRVAFWAKLLALTALMGAYIPFHDDPSILLVSYLGVIVPVALIVAFIF